MLHDQGYEIIVCKAWEKNKKRYILDTFSFYDEKHRRRTYHPFWGKAGSINEKQDFTGGR